MKISENDYQLTKKGEYEIQKMIKSKEMEHTIDLGIYKFTYCATCHGRGTMEGGTGYPNCKGTGAEPRR